MNNGLLPQFFIITFKNKELPTYVGSRQRVNSIGFETEPLHYNNHHFAYLVKTFARGSGFFATFLQVGGQLSTLTCLSQ